MRVCLVMPLGEIRGGSEMMLWHLVSQGQNLGIEWQVIFLQEGSLVSRTHGAGIKVHLVPSGQLRNPFSFWRTVIQIAQILKREQVDLVCNWIATAQLYGGIAGKLVGIPVIWYQLFVPTNKGIIDRMATALPTRLVIAVSQASATAQQQLMPRRETRVVYPGVELEKFDSERLPLPTDLRRKLGLPSDAPIIGIVGRLQRWKGMHTVLRALPIIQVKYPDAFVVIVGGEHAFEPDYLGYLQQEAKQLEIEKSVLFAGLQTNIAEWVNCFTVAVHASQSEPFGIVVIEAMALGKPVVATNTAGPLEIIRSEENGLLVPFEDDSALSEAILRYLDNPRFAKETGDNARMRAQDFSVTRYVNQIANVCREAIR